jgi:hypothetical protein
MIPCAPIFGPFAFRFQKMETREIYHLTCTTPNPSTTVIKCDCRGYTAHGTCKHADALMFFMVNNAA